jgi:hypothetical protein
MHGGGELFACTLCNKVTSKPAAGGAWMPPHGWRPLMWTLCRSCAAKLQADHDGTLERIERKLLRSTGDE